MIADICAMPFAPASFDLVVSLETIEHSPDPRTALGELVRVTKRDGRLIVSNPNYHGFIGLYRVGMRIVGRRFSEGGQPINHWTTLVGTVWHLKRLGCRIEAIDGAVLNLPVPRLGEIDLSWMDKAHFLAKWLARHGIVIATKA